MNNTDQLQVIILLKKSLNYTNYSYIHPCRSRTFLVALARHNDTGTMCTSVPQNYSGIVGGLLKALKASILLQSDLVMMI